MELLGIREGASFDVLAVMEIGGPCPALSQVKALASEYPDLYEQIKEALYGVLPSHGPDALEWKPLQGHIREFQFGGLPSPAFRIVWFEGRSARDVILSSAHLKVKGLGSTPEEAIPMAQKHREKYQYGLRPGRRNRICWLSSPSEL